MLTVVALMVAAPQACTTVHQQCRACTTIDGKHLCSNIGIACQPSLRICTPKDGGRPQGGPKAAGPRYRPAKKTTDA
jgi:hypothetical protein